MELIKLVFFVLGAIFSSGWKNSVRKLCFTALRNVRLELSMHIGLVWRKSEAEFRKIVFELKKVGFMQAGKIIKLEDQ